MSKELIFSVYLNSSCRSTKPPLEEDATLCPDKLNPTFFSLVFILGSGFLKWVKLKSSVLWTQDRDAPTCSAPRPPQVNLLNPTERRWGGQVWGLAAIGCSVNKAESALWRQWDEAWTEVPELKPLCCFPLCDRVPCNTEAWKATVKVVGGGVLRKDRKT